MNKQKTSTNKAKRSQGGYKRAVNSTCPNCNRMNAYYKTDEFKKAFDGITGDLLVIGNCQFCGYSRVYDRINKVFYNYTLENGYIKES